MSADEKPFDIREYIRIAFRRKWWVILPAACSVLIAFGVYGYLPKVYKASTLILVQPQRVPENYIRSTITESISERLNTISQEILSRTRLEMVIREFNLYREMHKQVPMEEVVETMRKAIEVQVHTSKTPGGRTQAQNTFTISYEGTEPRVVMMVANKLASLFIEENLKARELRAEGTSEFLEKELQSMGSQLQKKEESIRLFREKNIGQLPQQLEANLKTLERLQQQVKTTGENIKTGEDRIMALEREIERLESKKIELASTPVPEDPAEQAVPVAPVAPLAPVGPGPVREFPELKLPPDPLVIQWNNLKRELESAQAKYTDNYPDVILLKKKIAELEPKAAEALAKQAAAKEAWAKEREAWVKEKEAWVKEREAWAKEKEVLARERKDHRPVRQSPPPRPAPTIDPYTERLITQYRERINEAVIEIRRLRGEEKNLKDQILFYHKRVEDTPKREQELALLTRDYDLMKKNYDSLLEKKIQAQLAENLERKQQGEQFRVLDPARLPEKPIRPNRNKILLLGALLGMAFGVGLAWLKENIDQSFHSEADLKSVLGLPLIAVIPNLREKEKLLAR